jgi:hypothetical protein
MKISSPITMAYPGPPRRAGGLVRYAGLAVVLIVLLCYLRYSAPSFTSVHEPVQVTPADLPTIPTQESPSRPGVKPEDVPIEASPEVQTEHPITTPKKIAHPIDELIGAAEKTFEDLLKKESHDLKSAAAEYRNRRGRHPPPGFDVWFKFAQDNGAVMVEDFFDQIYHDLGPFWGLQPSLMRKEAWSYEMNINVRNHNASTGSGWFWTQIWLNLTQTIEHLLPDVDIALNAMDEPRIVVPWEEIDKYMEIERATRNMPPPSEVVSDFSTLSNKPDPDVKIRPKEWSEYSMLDVSNTLAVY